MMKLVTKNKTMKTIVFSEPVEAKLKELKIKTKVVRNIRNSTSNKTLAKFEFKEFLRRLTTSKDATSVIFNAFDWDRSPEQGQYWIKIYYELQKEE